MSRRSDRRAIRTAAKQSTKSEIKNSYIPPTKEQVSNIIFNGNLQGLNEALFPAGFGLNSINQVAFGQQAVSGTATMYANLRGYLVSNQRQLLSQSYVELGLIQAVIDIPIDDAFRGGIEVQSQQITPEQIKELQAVMQREGDIPVLMDAIRWNRLFGGSGVVILVDQNPEEPFDIKLLSRDKPLEFKAADLWELFYDKMNLEGFNPAIDVIEFEYYSYYGHRTHRSRVMKLKGLTAPSFIRPRLRGWGVSVIEGLIRSVNQHLKGVDLIFELLNEAKLDVYGFKNLADTLLMSNGTQQVMQRIQMANRQKNFQNALVLDSEDEYNQKELSFAGIADIMKEIRIQVAADMRMPMTKLFGMSASGFNSGEDDIENYNGMVESTIREKAKYDITRMVELRCQQLFGMIPTDIEIKFKPLRVMSSEQEENIKTQTFARILQASTAGKISDLEFRESINKDKLLPIQLDTTGFILDPNESSEAPDDVTSGAPSALGGDAITGISDGPNKSESETEKPVINEDS